MQIYGSLVDEQAVTLSRYSRLVGYTEWAFFGISHTDNPRYGVRRIWNQHQREDIANYLAEAQEMIEEIVDFPLKPRWIVGERYPFSYGFLTRWCKMIELGIQVTDDISLGATVTLGAVNCTITVSGVLPTLNPAEVFVFYPGTEERIDSTSVVVQISANPLVYEVVITIPRSRLIDYSQWDNPEEGWDALDDGNFQGTVDVKRIYNSVSVTTEALYQSNCTTSFSSETSEAITSFIENKEIGHVILRHDHCHSSCHCKNYAHVSINYKAGLTPINRTLESSIVRLAHSLMPSEPCSEPMLQILWERDRNIPKILTKERIECPFGMSDGAWSAWKWAQGNEVFRSKVLRT
jgi:hypothetical protein